MIGDQIPAGLEVEVDSLPAIRQDYLVRLGICETLLEGCFWTALGPARPVEVDPEQRADQEGPAAAPAQQEVPAPQPPAPRTMGERVERVEAEIRVMRESLDGQRADLAVMRRDMSWLVSSVSRLMGRQGLSHDLPDGTHVEASAVYERRVRRRTDLAETSGAQADDAAPDQHAA